MEGRKEERKGRVGAFSKWSFFFASSKVTPDLFGLVQSNSGEVCLWRERRASNQPTADILH